jgi:hypothetical protein
LSYLAGIVDGEGYFSKPSHKGALIIGNTSAELMTWLYDKLPGKISQDPLLQNRKQMYRFTIYGSQALLQLLGLLKPYLIIKQKQAENTITYLSSAYDLSRT